MKKYFLFFGFLMGFALGTAQAVPVDVELALLVDVSGSVDNSEYNLQKTGYINAFQDPAIQNLITGLPNGMAVTYIEWSGPSEQAQLVPWTLVNNATTANSFAVAIGGTSRAFFNGDTAPGSAINFTRPLFSGNGFEGARWVIDVSGDGTQNTGDMTAVARDAFLAAMAPGEGLTKVVNGLPIGSASLVSWYQNNIQGGPGSFVIAASNFADVQNAIRIKIKREVQVPEPATLALFGLGLAGLRLGRRRVSV